MKIAYELVGIVKANRCFTEARSLYEFNAASVNKGIVITGREYDGIAVFNDDAAKEECLGYNNVGHSCVRITNISTIITAVENGIRGLEAELSRSVVHGSFDNSAECTGIILYDTQSTIITNQDLACT